MKHLSKQDFSKLQTKMHALAFGMTLGLGSMYLGQGCQGVGSCPACGACAARLPILALPFLANGAFFLFGKIRMRLFEGELLNSAILEDEPVE